MNITADMRIKELDHITNTNKYYNIVSISKYDRKIRSGDLKRKIVIQEKTATRSVIGGETYTWSDLYPCRASIWPISSKEGVASLKLKLKNLNRIRFRYPHNLMTEIIATEEV